MPIELNSLGDNNCAYNSFALSLLYALESNEIAKYDQQALLSLCTKIQKNETKLPGISLTTPIDFLNTLLKIINNDYVAFQIILAKAMRQQVFEKISGDETIKTTFMDAEHGPNNEFPGHAKRVMQHLACSIEFQNHNDRPELNRIHNTLARHLGGYFLDNQQINQRCKNLLSNNENLRHALIADLLHIKENASLLEPTDVDPLKNLYKETQDTNATIDSNLADVTKWWNNSGKNEWIESLGTPGFQASDTEIGILGDIYHVRINKHGTQGGTMASHYVNLNPTENYQVTAEVKLDHNHYFTILPDTEIAREIAHLYNQPHQNYKECRTNNQQYQYNVQDTVSPTTSPQPSSSSAGASQPNPGGFSSAAPAKHARQNYAEVFNKIKNLEKTSSPSQTITVKEIEPNKKIQLTIQTIPEKKPEPSTIAGDSNPTTPKPETKILTFEHASQKITTQNKIDEKTAELMAATMKAAGLEKVTIWAPTPEELNTLEIAFKATFGRDNVDKIEPTSPVNTPATPTTPTPGLRR